MLVYTGKEVFTIKSVPPNIGAIMPPLHEAVSVEVRGKPCSGGNVHARKRRGSSTCCPADFGAKYFWRPPVHVPVVIQHSIIDNRRQHVPVQYSPHRLHDYHINDCCLRTTDTTKGRTVALRLMPTVLAVTANCPSTMANMMQNTAVTNVLPARDKRRPRGDSIKYAPSYECTTP